jgi:hypothetical protein
MDAHVPTFRVRLLSFATAGAVALAALLVPGTTAGAAARPSAVQKKVVAARTAAKFPMPAPGMAAVQTVTLPAGTWSVIAKASAIDFSSTDIVRCEIYDRTHKASLDSSAYQVGSSGVIGGTITNLASITVAGGSTVKVQQRCGHDGSAGNSAYLDPDASIVAFRTLDGTAATQSLVRTAGATALSSSSTTVLNFTLPAGTYAIGFKSTGVLFSGSATAICSIDGPRGYAGDTAVNVGGATDVATDAFFTYMSSFGGGSMPVSVACAASGAPGAYLDPGAVLWARKVKAVTAVEGGCGASLVNATTDLVAVVRPYQPCAFMNTDTALSQAYVPKGTWVAVGGESDVYSNSAPTDFVRCALSTAEHGHIDGSAATEVIAQDLGVTLLGTVKTTTPETFQELCHRDSGGVQSTSLAGSLVLIRV